MSHNKVTIKVETILGENEDFDKSFFEYLEEYYIEYKINEKEDGEKWPKVEYTGGPIAIGNMLKERFGYLDHEIYESYPEIKDLKNE